MMTELLSPPLPPPPVVPPVAPPLPPVLLPVLLPAAGESSSAPESPPLAGAVDVVGALVAFEPLPDDPAAALPCGPALPAEPDVAVASCWRAAAAAANSA